MALRYRVVETPLGHAGYVASKHGLCRVYLPQRSAASLRRAIRADEPDAGEDPTLLPELADGLRRYFAGEDVTFNVPIDWSRSTPFDVAVWKACRRIGYGHTRTYGALAERIGRPGGARAVGTALGRNPCPIVVPCHRVLRTDGGMGGFSAPGGVDVKRQLLEMESGQPV